MLSRWLGAKRAPRGYPDYDAEAFVSHFDVPPSVGRAMRRDYLAVAHSDRRDAFTRLVIESFGNLGAITPAAAKRYKADNRTAVAVARFLGRVASAVSDQRRQVNIGITRCRWRSVTCPLMTADPSVSHQDLEGAEFDVGRGLETPDGFLLPGVLFDCLCSAEAIIPGVEI